MNANDCLKERIQAALKSYLDEHGASVDAETLAQQVLLALTRRQKARANLVHKRYRLVHVATNTAGTESELNNLADDGFRFRGLIGAKIALMEYREPAARLRLPPLRLCGRNRC